LVVTVITTDLPRSPFFGVYVNEKGDVEAEPRLNVPLPFEVNVTLVAVPPKVFPDKVIGVNPHIVPPELLRVTVGGFTHCPNVTAEKKIKGNTKRKALVIFYITNLT
jgi:hypothetical protein